MAKYVLHIVLQDRGRLVTPAFEKYIVFLQSYFVLELVPQVINSEGKSSGRKERVRETKIPGSVFAMFRLYTVQEYDVATLSTHNGNLLPNRLGISLMIPKDQRYSSQYRRTSSGTMKICSRQGSSSK